MAKKQWYKKWWVITLLIIIVLWVIVVFSTGQGKQGFQQGLNSGMQVGK